MEQRPLYIFDVDGTITDVEHRRHLVRCEKPDWKGFFDACDQDSPIKPVIETMRRLRESGAEIWIWSGRSDRVKDKTIQWLLTHDVVDKEFFVDAMHEPNTFIMREEGDFTPDEELKMIWLRRVAPADVKRIVAVFDDRTKVVKAWRKAGITCFQVVDGDF